jgi:CRISPR-associated protein (TIGR03986 family)
MPRHVNPTSSDRTATAPYNFVPLPERVFEVVEGIEVDGRKIKPWEMHDRFVPGTHSGWIDLAIETLTPLYIRGAVGQKEDGRWNERDSRLRPDPYMTPEGRPAIPGSSLRGMVRTLVEILSFSKIQPVDTGRPFFRTVAPDRIGRAYGERMRRGAGVQGGRLCREGNEWSILKCDVLRVKRSILPSGIHQGNRPNWAHQQKPCWVEVDGDHVSRIEFGRQSGPSWKQGNLILTGDVPRKRREFVFLDTSPDAERVVVPERIWDRFHDADQITQWQGRAFPQNQPPGTTTRPAPGHFRDGEPVFFLVDDTQKGEENPDGIVFFLGRAGMFRLPYDRSPADLVPQDLREVALDLAEAMFGKVGTTATIKGRVHFEDAVATNGGPDWCEEVVVPRILSAPKPTTFQHYLTQDGTKGKDQLTTYLEGDHTTIRGHKLYWHRGPSPVKESSNHDELLRDLQGANPNDTQHTIVRPVKAGVAFAGRIRFENLTDLELGSLLQALQLPDGCCHRVGMGKPLGLGSIRIAARLRLLDRAARYRTWQSTGVQENEDGGRFRRVFEEAMIEHARSSQEAQLSGGQGLRRIARLDALFQLLAWANRPAPAATAYMDLDLDRFRDRPVLPTPHNVARAGEPPWRADPPRPAAGEGGGSGSRGRRPDRTQDARRQTVRGERPQPAPPRAPPVKPKPVEKGQTRPGTLKRSGEVWVALFDGDSREAHVINPDKIPADCSDGTKAELYIAEQSKNVGIRCRLERMAKGPKAAP